MATEPEVKRGSAHTQEDVTNGGSGSSSASLEYNDAITRFLQQDKQNININLDSLPRNKIIEPPRGITPAEELSFKLFDGQCLQYADKTCNGMYDIWGSFIGVDPTKLVEDFPTLDKLKAMPYIEGDKREVVVFDATSDQRLQNITNAALRILDHSLKTAGAIVCAQELARLVAKELGGTGKHSEVAERYQSASDNVKRRNNSFTIHIGELCVGISRHRALLLKWLADLCDLPCRILRGDFYLGAAGKSGENAVVMLEFNGHEWMVELVTEPGRLFRVQSKTVPTLTRKQLWDGRTPRDDPGVDRQGRNTTTAHGFPTVPKELDEADDEITSSSSGGQKEGLNWTELDGQPMEDLGHSEEDVGSQRRRSSMEQQSIASAASGGSAAEQRRAAVDRNLSDLHSRRLAHSEDDGSEGNQRSGMKASRSLSELRPESHQVQEVRSSDEWTPVESNVSVRLADNPDELQLEDLHAFVPGRGRTVEFEVEGLTVTHAQGLDKSHRSLDTLVSDAPKAKAETERGASLESTIGRHRTTRPYTKDLNTMLEDLRHREHPRLSNTSSEDPGSRSTLQQLSTSGTAQEPEDVKRPSAPQVAPQDTGNKGTIELLTQRISGLATQNVKPPAEKTASTRNSMDSADDAATGTASVRSADMAQGSIPINGGSQGSHASLEEQMMQNSQLRLARIRSEGSQGDQRQRKAYRSSDGTFFDTRSMASTVKDADRTRLQHQIQQAARDSQPGSASSTQKPETGTSSDSATGSQSVFSEANEAEVEFSEIELGPRIGIGCFGEVFKARWRQTTVAVKRLFDQSLSEQSLKEFRAEVLLCQRLKHPNVIMFMGACTKPPNLSIITQWAPRGSLFHLLHGPNPNRLTLTLRQKLRMALDIARGMHYLHSAKPPVIHRDLKSMNLLVDNDLTIKVCDFGLARIRSSTWMSGKSQGGTPEWTAPEVLRNLQYNEKSDVYSYGVVLFELATGKEPWDEMTPMQVVGAVGWGGNRIEPPEDCTPIFARLMKRCFADELRDRPSFDMIIRELQKFASETRQGAAKTED